MMGIHSDDIPGIALDAGLTGASAVTVYLTWHDVLDWSLKIVISVLVIVLLIMRIRSHVRRDKVEKREGRQ